MKNIITFAESPPKKNPPLDMGQYYKHTNDGVYILARTSHGLYALIGLVFGNRWSDPALITNVDAIFSNQRNDFELVTSPFTVTPGE